ncbi:hypothetical protein D3C80_1379370 [compost metagenome]
MQPQCHHGQKPYATKHEAHDADGEDAIVGPAIQQALGQQIGTDDAGRQRQIQPTALFLTQAQAREQKRRLRQVDKPGAIDRADHQGVAAKSSVAQDLAEAGKGRGTGAGSDGERFR